MGWLDDLHGRLLGKLKRLQVTSEVAGWLDDLHGRLLDGEAGKKAAPEVIRRVKERELVIIDQHSRGIDEQVFPLFEDIASFLNSTAKRRKKRDCAFRAERLTVNSGFSSHLQGWGVVLSIRISSFQWFPILILTASVRSSLDLYVLLSSASYHETQLAKIEENLLAKIEENPRHDLGLYVSTRKEDRGWSYSIGLQHFSSDSLKKALAEYAEQYVNSELR